MRRPLTTAALLAAALAVPLTAPSAAAADPPGIHVEGTRLVERSGAPLVLRGVNHAHTWYPGETQAFADIGALGANAVRTVLSSGDRWTRDDVADVQRVVALAKDAGLVSVLEVHDTTGWGEEGAAAPLSSAVDHWISVKDALVGQEDYVLVNIGNEPYGNVDAANATYVEDTIDAIRRLRGAGIRNAIVVDAPNWGQDWRGTMRDHAREIFEADPDRNVVFSVHMYGVYGEASTIRAYLDAFEAAGLPLVVGEFGYTHSDGDVDEDTILAETRVRGIGWLGWSWSGNGGGVEYLDLVTDFDASRLTPWGERLLLGADGVQETSHPAAVFGADPGPDPDPEPDPDPNPDPEPGTSCTAALTVAHSWPGGFQATVTVTASTARSGWTTSFTLPSGVSIATLWSGTPSGSSGAVSVANAPWNGSLEAGASTTFGFIGSGAAPAQVPVTCG